MNLWKDYKAALHDAISLHNGVGNVWANWESKGTTLLAKTYTNEHLIKSREVEIWSDCLLYTSPSPRDRTRSRMPSSA